jgi:6-phosphogluconolactonase
MISHPNINFLSFDTRDAMVSAIEAATIDALQVDIATIGKASWAVSGGSTPKPLFEAISKRSLAWEAIDIALVDERWVAKDHPRSNEAFAQNSLIQDKASEVTLTGMYVDGKTPSAALDEVEARYQSLARPLTNVLLGMGPDGHTASLFPEAKGLENAFDDDGKNLCAAVTANKSDVTGDEVERITLTFPAIRDAKSIFLMITGDAKLDALRSALEHDTHLPIARVINGLTKPLQIYWAP